MPERRDGDTDNVRVVVRCRPMSENETRQGCQQAVQVNELAGQITVSNPQAQSGEPPKQFSYDCVFGLDSKQLDVYNQAARPIVENVLEGYNGTIFAYGQTGTGKTFTMEGVRDTAELKGIIPNSFAHIFGHIAKCGDDKTFLVRVSYLEIYNEEIRDLLGKNQTKALEIKERPDVGVYVKDLSSVTVSGAAEMDKIMTIGNKNRSVGATNMNEHSSRSHAIFTVTVECSELGPDRQQHVRVGKLHLVDLAGSERQSKTGATGQRLKEATKINLSLSTLGNVISALVDAKSTHIPYRNSKLTRMLQDSLGGNSKTVMCANIGPADYNYDETVSTLRYASRAKQIKNNAHINEDPKDAMLRKFQQEIEELKRQLADGGEGGYEDGGSASEGDEDNEVEGVVKTKKKRIGMSDEHIKEIEAQIAADRKKLEEEQGMADEERKRITDELRKREDELQFAKEEHDLLAKKLEHLEKRVIVGGENLLEKMEEQSKLLDQNARELEQRKQKEQELRKALEQKQAERLDIEEKYSSLQDEAQGKSKKLKKVWTLLMSAKAEMTDVTAEHQREMEGLLENVRQLSKELRLQMLVIDSFIPQQYQELIERNVHYNEDVGDWQLKCVAYTGNNMRKRDEAVDVGPSRPNVPNLSSVYLNYNEAGAGIKVIHGQPDARAASARSAKKTAKKQRDQRDRAKLNALLH